MDRTTIDADGFKISNEKDKTVKGLMFDFNEKISHLPDSPYDIFPNLMAYTAGRCEIKNISHNHFKNLHELKFLYLYDNQIEIIYYQTFKDLTSLVELDLSKKLF